MRALSATRSRSAPRTSARSSTASRRRSIPTCVGRADAPQLGRRSSGRELAGQAAGDQQTQHGVQATDRPGAMRDQVVVTFREQPQHRGVVLEYDGAELRVPQRDDRGGAGVVRVGLVDPARVEQPCTRRERRRHIEHESHRPRRAAAPTAHPCPTRLRSPNTAVRTVPRTPPTPRVGDARHARGVHRRVPRARRAPPRCVIPCGDRFRSRTH